MLRDEKGNKKHQIDWKNEGLILVFSDYIFDRPGFPCTLSVAMLKSKKEWKGIVKQSDKGADK